MPPPSFLTTSSFSLPQKNREANREAELNRAEEEEAEEDRDPVEREEMLRRESKQRRAEVDQENLLKRLAEAERDNMCDVMWTMCLVHKKSVTAAMAETRNWGKRKARWEREQAELATAELAPTALAPRHGGGEGDVPGHWGEQGMQLSPGSGSPGGAVAAAAAAAAAAGVAALAASEPASVAVGEANDESSCLEPVLKKARGQWNVLPSTLPARASPASDGGGRSHGGGGGGGSGSMRDLRKPASIRGFKLKFKDKRTLGRKARAAAPPLPPAMAEAAAAVSDEDVEMKEATVEKPSAESGGGGATLLWAWGVWKMRLLRVQGRARGVLERSGLCGREVMLLFQGWLFRLL